MGIYYLNNKYCTENEAVISVLDLGLLRGYGVFDYLRTYQRRPFHLREHLLRLQYSAKVIGLSLPNSLEEIEKIILNLIEHSSEDPLSIKILVTGGVSSDHFLPEEKSSLILHAYPLKEYPSHFYQEGIQTVTTMLGRIFPQSKTLNYIPAITILKNAKNAKEAFYLNAKREFLEGTTSNFFVFKNRRLITPHSEELLLGITREIVLRLGKEHFEVEERPIAYEEIETFDECFLTSSTRELLPVVQIDEKKIGKGSPGPLTRHLRELFTAYTEQTEWPLLQIARYEN
jgi:branched-chain amino acid aminotransferase